ncbi:MAG: pseudouridine-5'-phosphate glycosidase [Deltaproteobacteria bacterium]|nr:pseudouridine-5'-phosphate glycosidase [Deltaproteobacteria bacterium]
MSRSRRRPRVALESTLLYHGVPRRRGLEVFDRLCAAVEGAGAEPCLIGIVDGSVRVGLGRRSLAQMLAREAVAKVGARGIAGAVARHVCAATTVSATMAIAADAGIAVFATGGIGGVHRGAVASYDESEDLVALSRYPVAVVSAGAKAILDLPRTVERLETLGVPVIGFGTDRFSAFYSNRSPVAVAERVDDVAELARLARVRLGGRYGRGGLLVVTRVPIAHEIAPRTVERAVTAALAQARRQGARGAAVTPAALAALNAIAGGRFLETNIAVVASNARLAAALAVALARRRA